MAAKLSNGVEEFWTWSEVDKSHQVMLKGRDRKEALFHPRWSNGTVAVRGTKPLNRARHYWEIRVKRRIFGTSMMLGVGTAQARLHADSYTNLIGEDKNSWGLSHKGLLWHDGRCRDYTNPFPENVSTTIGVSYDGASGSLTFYKDGVCLGEAYKGSNLCTDDLYPMISSSAAKTVMTLGLRRRAPTSLRDRCRAAVLSSLKSLRDVSVLPLPNLLKTYISSSFD